MSSKKAKMQSYKEELVGLFVRAGKDSKLMQEFMIDITTPAELEEMAIRWQIVKRLNKGEKHREIAGELGIGISTVTRGSRELRNKKGGFAMLLDKIKK